MIQLHIYQIYIQTYMYLLFQILFPYTLLENTECSSLCYDSIFFNDQNFENNLNIPVASQYLVKSVMVCL